MNNMPPWLRKDCASDPQYRTCLRKTALNDHVCRPRPLDGQLIEWEHAIIVAGKQLQEKWALVPICWYVHSGPGMVKEINVWLALNRATDDELRRVSRAVDYIRERERLNIKYGMPGVPKRKQYGKK